MPPGEVKGTGNKISGRRCRIRNAPRNTENPGTHANPVRHAAHGSGDAGPGPVAVADRRRPEGPEGDSSPMPPDGHRHAGFPRIRGRRNPNVGDACGRRPNRAGMTMRRRFRHAGPAASVAEPSAMGCAFRFGARADAYRPRAPDGDAATPPGGSAPGRRGQHVRTGVGSPARAEGGRCSCRRIPRGSPSAGWGDAPPAGSAVCRRGCRHSRPPRIATRPECRRDQSGEGPPMPCRGTRSGPVSARSATEFGECDRTVAPRGGAPK